MVGETTLHRRPGSIITTLPVWGGEGFPEEEVTIEARKKEVTKVTWAAEESFRQRVRLNEGVVPEPLQA